MDAAMRCGHTGARFGVQPFIAAASFAGARAGYAFKLGAQGAGYYADRGPCYEEAPSTCRS